MLGVAAAYKAFQIGKGFVDAGIQMQSLTAKMGAATGSAQIAAESLQFVREEANRLGMDFRSTADGFASFAASALRSGLTFKETKDIFSGVSEAATAMRLSSERTALVFQALSQMASKGTVSMEELKQQLGESLPGALQFFAKAMGKPNDEFIKMISNGEVTTRDLIKLGDGLRTEFGASAIEAAQGAQAAFNRFGNAIFDLNTRFAEGGFLDVVTNAVKDLTALLNDPETKAGLTSFAEGLATIASAAVKAASAIGSFFSEASDRKQAIEELAKLGRTPTPDAIADMVNTIQLRRQAINAPWSGPTASATPSASGGYTLGGGSSGGVSAAAEKAARLRARLLNQVGNIDEENARVSDPQKAAALKLEEQQKKLKEALDAKAITEEEYRDKSLQAEIAFQDRLTDIRQKAADIEVGIRQETYDNIAGFLEVFASKNKAIAMALIVFEKARAIAQAIMATHVAATTALIYDPTGATSARVTALGYANVAAIAATGIAQLATMGMGGGGGGGASSYSGGGYTAPDSDYSGASSSQDIGSKSVYITLEGDDATFYSKNNIRKLISSINDALGDGSRLNVLAAS